MILGFSIVAAIASLTPAAFAGPSTYEIWAGNVTAYPETSQLYVPVYVTSPQDVLAWSTTVEYDTGLLSFAAVELVDTESEPLSTTIELTPTTPPHQGVRLTYDAQTPLPAGQARHVANLIFTVDSSAFPSGSGSLTTEIILGGPGVEAFPPLFELANGSSQTPTGATTTLLMYFGSMLQVVSTAGSYLEHQDTPIRVELRLWTDAPTTTLRAHIGPTDLVDPWLVLAPDFGGTILEDVADQATVTLEPNGDEVQIWISFPSPLIPATTGDPVLFIEVQPIAPLHGEINLPLDPTACELDGDPIANLLGGELSLWNHFIRGDFTFDGLFDVVDPLALILWALASGDAPVCPDAADVNDNGEVNVADGVHAFTILFSTSPPPPPPFDAPGEDPTDDAIDCLPALVP